MLSFNLTFGAVNLRASMIVLCCDFLRPQPADDVPAAVDRGLER